MTHHSDRGSQYLSLRYSERLAEAGIEPSVGSKGDSYDNALAETISGLYKAELIQLHFAAVLKRGRARRYLKALAVIQERMGELSDLVVARNRYQAIVAADPAAWFALGWLAARIVEARAAARPALVKLARTDPPTT